MEEVLLVYAAIYGPILTWMICLLFHQRAMSNLRDQHSKEREEGWKARHEEREIERKQRNGEREKLRDDERKRLEKAELLGRVKVMSEELDKLARRVALIETERDGHQQGRA